MRAARFDTLPVLSQPRNDALAKLVPLPRTSSSSLLCPRSNFASLCQTCVHSEWSPTDAKRFPRGTRKSPARSRYFRTESCNTPQYKPPSFLSGGSSQARGDSAVYCMPRPASQRLILRGEMQQPKRGRARAHYMIFFSLFSILSEHFRALRTRRCTDSAALKCFITFRVARVSTLRCV